MSAFLRGVERALGLPPKPSLLTPEQVVERALQRAYARLTEAVERVIDADVTRDHEEDER